MLNPLAMLALGAVAVGYAGAVDHIGRNHDAMPVNAVVAFPAAAGLSVTEFVGKLPETVQDPLCDAKATITASLADDFAEKLEAEWVPAPSVRAELWASDLMGTWTVLHTASDGGPDSMVCVVSSGFGWTEGIGPEQFLQDRPLS